MAAPSAAAITQALFAAVGMGSTFSLSQARGRTGRDKALLPAARPLSFANG